MNIILLQKEIVELYKKYSETNKKIIKTNLKKSVIKEKIKPKELAKELQIPLNTMDKIINVHSNYKPDFMVTMIICDFLNITIEDILKQVTIPNVSARFKWTKERKQKFLEDYSELHLTELSKKYNITRGTAKEYTRVFKTDLEEEI